MKKKIMVVDDEPDISTLVKIVLETNGFDVVVFNKAKDAMEQLKKGNQPDLIILDARMPDIDGNEFCNQVSASGVLSKLKIIVFTALSDVASAFLKKKNVVGFIPKPFDNAELIKEVQKHLGNKAKNQKKK